MWPGTWGDGQGLEQTNGGTVRDLVLGTNWASQHKLPDILANGGPPKSLADGSQRPPDSWMAGNPGFMTPLKDLRAQCLRHEQPTRRTLNWHFYPSSGPFHTLLDVPGESPYHYSFREYGISRGLFSWVLELAGKCIGLNIFGPGPVRKLPVANVIITFSWVEAMGEICTGVHLPITRRTLGQDCAYPDIRGIHLNNELPFGIWSGENRSRDKPGLKIIKGLLSLGTPGERYLGGGESR